ncbi:MADS-box transcription factor [Parasponia andersonii]|uniref:MADS-box transcription factor n=1 Tax=Parasponia andersonii TaxID=3476 RepID=A0A2P5D8I6_PARAD|nr:MADS-box transcription factor [Parasponia andersonii]
MTRKKVKLAYISNDSARKATFKKRKKGMMKKVSELSTLCDIDACAIIYSPYDTQPEVFPSVAGVHRVLAKFRRMPEMEQSKKMVNQEGFLRQRISKAGEQLKKQRKENREKEMTRVMFHNLTGKMGLQGLSVMDLNDLTWMIDHHLKDIHKRMETIAKNKRSVRMAAAVDTGKQKRGGGESSHAAAAAMNVENTNNGMQRQQQWLMGLMNPHQQDHDKSNSSNNNNNNSHGQHMGFGGDEMIMPFGDNNNWSNGFFP